MGGPLNLCHGYTVPCTCLTSPLCSCQWLGPQKFLHNVPTCLMSLKEEGTHNQDFKINSRRQSISVLGSAPGWWSHLFEWTLATVPLEAFEVLAVTGLCQQKAGPVHRWQPPFQPQSWWGGWGKILSCRALPWAFPLPVWLCLPVFPLWGVGLNEGVTSMSFPSSTGQAYAECLVVPKDYTNKCTKAVG